MDINPQEIIRIKRDGGELTQQQLAKFFQDYLAGTVSDYQTSAMLMAMYLRGLSRQETLNLMRLSMHSGQVLEWSYPAKNVVDKHSTGGIGDKTSLIILPLLAAEGLKMPMISGRGLGHTGGTLDKLEAIPGMQVRIDTKYARELVEKFGGAFMGQTEEIALLDKKLYALRDVTSTVESRDLICASILSKKLAEGLGSLVLDVKFGSGAFIQDKNQAEELGQLMVDTASAAGVSCTALLTSMSSPLGRAAGNGLEVIECVELLKGNQNTGADDTLKLSLELSAELLVHSGKYSDLESAESALNKRIGDGSGLEKFLAVIKAQGGDTTFLEDPSKAPRAKLVREVCAEDGGHCSAIDVRKLGIAILALGGGRQQVTDVIDPWVGLTGLAHVGEKIEKGTPIAVVHGQTEEQLQRAVDLVTEAYSIGEEPKSWKLVEKRLTPQTDSNL